MKENLPKECVHRSKFFSGNLCFRAPFVHIYRVSCKKSQTLLGHPVISLPKFIFSLHYSIGPDSQSFATKKNTTPSNLFAIQEKKSL